MNWMLDHVLGGCIVKSYCNRLNVTLSATGQLPLKRGLVRLAEGEEGFQLTVDASTVLNLRADP